jgi:hypothetical protein
MKRAQVVSSIFGTLALSHLSTRNPGRNLLPTKLLTALLELRASDHRYDLSAFCLSSTSIPSLAQLGMSPSFLHIHPFCLGFRAFWLELFSFLSRKFIPLSRAGRGHDIVLSSN